MPHTCKVTCNVQDAAAAPNEEDLDIEGGEAITVPALRSSSNASKADAAAKGKADETGISSQVTQEQPETAANTEAVAEDEKDVKADATKQMQEQQAAADKQLPDDPQSAQPAGLQPETAGASEDDDDEPIGKRRGVKRKQSTGPSKESQLQQQGSISKSSKGKAAVNTAEHKEEPEEEEKQTGRGRGGRGRGKGGRAGRGRGRGKRQNSRGKAKSLSPESSSSAEQDQAEFADALDSPSQSQQPQSPSQSAGAGNAETEPAQQKADPPEVGDTRKNSSSQDKPPPAKRIKRSAAPDSADQKEVPCYNH